MRILRLAALSLSLLGFLALPAFAQEEREYAADGTHEPAQEAHGEEAHGDGHGDHHLTLGMIFGNSQFLATLATFTILVFVLVWGYKKAGAPALQNRRREIEEALNEAQAKKAEAEAMREEYKGRLARMEDELAKIREQMIKAGEVERDRIVAEAEAKAATMRKDVQFQISQKMKSLRDELAAEAVAHAVAAAEEVIKKEATAADQTRLADAYLEELGNLPAAERAHA